MCFGRQVLRNAGSAVMPCEWVLYHALPLDSLSTFSVAQEAIRIWKRGTLPAERGALSYSPRRRTLSAKAIRLTSTLISAIALWMLASCSSTAVWVFASCSAARSAWACK